MQTEFMGKLWEKAKEAIKNELPENSHAMWIEPLEFVRADQERAVLRTPNLYSKKWILANYTPLLEKHFLGGSDKRLALEIEVREPGKKSARRQEPPAAPPLFPEKMTRPAAGRYFKPDYTFDSFVVGACNDFAYTASLALATNRCRSQNVLYLYSQTGLGKSHLSQAVAQEMLRLDPEQRVYYMTAEDFYQEMVLAMRDNTLHRFKEKYRKKCDALLLENVDFLSRKDRTQSELAGTLDSLVDSGKRLIFTSGHMPGDIPQVKDAMRSRLGSGLVLSMEKPDYKVRVRILKRKARRSGCSLPMPVIEFLAQELADNVRQLESGLQNVVNRASLLGAPIDMVLAEEAVRHLINAKEALTLGNIKKFICHYYRVSPEDLGGPSRKQGIVRPRQIAMFLARKYTEHSLPAIGQAFNRRHATALHAVAAVSRHLRDKDNVGRQVEILCKRIESGSFWQGPPSALPAR
jgi:chromosomal replication initiator protein